MEVNVNLTELSRERSTSFANEVQNGWTIHLGWDCKQFAKVSLTAEGVLNFDGTLKSTISWSDPSRTRLKELIVHLNEGLNVWILQTQTKGL
ncbi:MAG: hypothetical protein ACTS4X_00325 [Candidatus Hodgkinia cicadicola]